MNPPAQRARKDLSRTSTPLDAYVIESVASDGTVRRTYYDARTFLIVRRETDVAGNKGYAVYDDFVSDAAGGARTRVTKAAAIASPTKIGIGA